MNIVFLEKTGRTLKLCKGGFREEGFEDALQDGFYKRSSDVFIIGMILGKLRVKSVALNLLVSDDKSKQQLDVLDKELEKLSVNSFDSATITVGSDDLAIVKQI